MNERMQEKVDILKKEHGSLDPFVIIQERGLGLKYVNFPTEVLGRYMKTFTRPTIFLNESLEMSNQRYFVACHELCHALEHEEVSSYYLLNSKSRSKMEQEANAFAFTMCMNMFLQEHETDSMSSIDLEMCYGVPIKLSEILL